MHVRSNLFIINYFKMKKVSLLAIAILFAGISAMAANVNPRLTDTTKTKKTKLAKVQYTCSMHPEVLLDKPGKCPKCGMTLVKKQAPKKAEKTKM